MILLLYGWRTFYLYLKGGEPPGLGLKEIYSSTIGLLQTLGWPGFPLLKTNNYHLLLVGLLKVKVWKELVR